MRGLWRHARVRFRATIRSPEAVVVVVFSGLVTLALSPTAPLIAVDANEPIDRVALPLITIQCLWLWPALITRAVAGRSTGSMWSAVEPPIPQLPVGMRSRVLAEVLVVCALALAVRSCGFFMEPLGAVLPGLPSSSEAGYGLAFAVRWPLDVLVFVPVIAAWAFPTRSPSMVMLRPLIAALVVYAAVQGGLYTHTGSAIVASALLTAVMVAPWGRDLAWATRWVHGLSPQRPLWRRPHAAQFRRDLCWLPLARNRAVVIVALLGQGILLVVEGLGLWPPMAFHMGSSVVFGLLLAHVVLRPLGSPMLMSSVSGLGKHRLGDFAAAWSVLPVPRHSVLRGVYGHGLLGGLLLWALMTCVFFLRAWMEMGGAAWMDTDMQATARLLLPAVFVAPMLAGLLVSLAAGAQGFGLVVGALLIGYLPAQMVLLARTETAAPFVLAAALGAVAGLPPLVHLRRPAG